jgi:hypothetical protein
MNEFTKIAASTAILLSLGGLAFADHNTRISPRRHANLAAAQEYAEKAFYKVEDAQRANEFDLGGHAARAKTLLQQASEEMKLAAMDANRENFEERH